MAAYEIWLTNTDGKEIRLVVFDDDLGLTDEQAKDAAQQTLQDMIDIIETPSPYTVDVRMGLQYPITKLLRRREIEDELGG